MHFLNDFAKIYLFGDYKVLVHMEFYETEDGPLEGFTPYVLLKTCIEGNHYDESFSAAVRKDILFDMYEPQPTEQFFLYKSWDKAKVREWLLKQIAVHFNTEITKINPERFLGKKEHVFRTVYVSAQPKMFIKAVEQFNINSVDLGNQDKIVIEESCKESETETRFQIAITNDDNSHLLIAISLGELIASQKLKSDV